MSSPESYQWGKMSRGQPYVMLATDIFRAIGFLGLRGVELPLLFYVIEHTWGRTAKRGRKGETWPPTEPLPYDLKAIARDLRLDPKNVSEAKIRLVRSHIINASKEGLLVNKEVHEWIKADESGPRIDPEPLAYAVSAQKLKSTLLHPVTTGQISGHDRSPIRLRPDDQSGLIRSQPDETEGSIRLRPDAAQEDRTRGNPTGLIQNPTGSHSNASELGEAATSSSGGAPRKPSKATPKQRGLALSDDEPFISPPDALPLPMATVAPIRPEAGALHAHMLKITRSADYPEGRGDLADHAAKLLETWVDGGWQMALVKAAIHKAIKTGAHLEIMRLTSYVRTVLISYADTAANIPAAPAVPFSPPSDANAKRAALRASFDVYRQPKEASDVEGR